MKEEKYRINYGETLKVLKFIRKYFELKYDKKKQEFKNALLDFFNYGNEYLALEKESYDNIFKKLVFMLELESLIHEKEIEELENLSKRILKSPNRKLDNDDFKKSL